LLKEAIKVPDQVLIENNDQQEVPGAEAEKEPPKKNAAVTKERIERLKKAFKPSWLFDMINSIDKNPPKNK